MRLKHKAEKHFLNNLAPYLVTIMSLGFLIGMVGGGPLLSNRFNQSADDKHDKIEALKAEIKDEEMQDPNDKATLDSLQKELQKVGSPHTIPTRK